MQSSFKFSPAILVRLGEELVPHPTDGLLELVKNAYDADASKCTIKIKKNSLSIEDDGEGMTDDEIVQGWLLIGGSKKSSKTPTTKGRIPVGNKGLGRLAALRLGTKVTLISRPKAKPGVEFRMKINWNKVDKSHFVEQEQFQIKSYTTKQGSGTEIVLEHLKIPLPADEISKLSKSMLLLSDPFNNEVGFYASVKAEEFEELAKLAKINYFSDADFHLRALLDEDGMPSATVLDWQGKVLFSSKPQDFKKAPYRSPSTTFDLWVFKLNNQSFSAKNSNVQDVREWLRVVGGVHLYHGGMRVRPFGEPGHDWLEMDRKRAASPEERPSTNVSIGQVKVADLNQILRQKTDRSGFIENEAFHELKRFAVDSLNWMASRRLGVAEDRRERKRTATSSKALDARKALEQTVIDTVPQPAQKSLLSAIKKFENAQQQEAVALREDLQLYRSVATAGSTSAVFAHESHKPLTQILTLAASIKHRASTLLGDLFHQKLEEPLKLLAQAARALQLFSQLPLNLLKRDKRRNEVVDVVKSTKELVGYLEAFFLDAKIQLEFHPPNHPVEVSGSRALVESIIANMAMNGLKAFDSHEARIVGRVVEIRVFADERIATIKVLDNGPGIRHISVDDIWLPGRTTSPDGTGFGLTIVRDSVADLRGNHSALENGELGGAEFTITIPISK